MIVCMEKIAKNALILKLKGDSVRRMLKIFAVCYVSIFLASCSAGIGDHTEKQAPLKTLSCVAVMPAGSSVDKEDAGDSENARSLVNGAAFVTEIMARQLNGNNRVRLVNSQKAASLAPEVSGGLSGMVGTIGKQLGCDGVLITTVRRFKQRGGTEYASDDPASADLHMALLHTSGAVLWTADYRETQESLLDNVLSFDKMQARGFKWLSVEQLVEQGLAERLATCPYLK